MDKNEMVTAFEFAATLKALHEAKPEERKKLFMLAQERKADVLMKKEKSA